MRYHKRKLFDKKSTFRIADIEPGLFKIVLKCIIIYNMSFRFAFDNHEALVYIIRYILVYFSVKDLVITKFYGFYHTKKQNRG